MSPRGLGQEVMRALGAWLLGGRWEALTRLVSFSVPSPVARAENWSLGSIPFLSAGSQERASSPQPCFRAGRAWELTTVPRTPLSWRLTRLRLGSGPG